MAVARLGNVVWAVVAAPVVDGTSPANRRSASLGGKARRRWLSNAMSFPWAPSPAPCGGLTEREAHNGRWPLSRDSGPLVAVVPAAIGVCTAAFAASCLAADKAAASPGASALFFDICRTSTSARPIPPPSRDMETASCWSYISWYCLAAGVFSGLS
ncbi:hypothetical protein D3C85_1113010 [compost metagenome]